MGQITDILIILSAKTIVLIGFIALIKWWFRRGKNNLPRNIYWLLGIFFVLIQFSHIIESLLMNLFYSENALLFDKGGIASMSVLAGIAFYIFIGIRFFPKRKMA